MALDVVTTSDFSGASQNIATIKVAGNNIQASAIIDKTGVPIDSATPFNVTLATTINPQDDAIRVLPVPGIGSWMQKSADYSSNATAALWTPTGGKRVVVTEIFVEWSGGTDGNIFVWSSVSSTADTTYSAGTDRLLFQVHATPSTKGAGGYGRTVYFPAFGADYPILVTRSSAIACTVALSGEEV